MKTDGIILVKVGEWIYPTIIDEDGRQRFVGNRVVRKLLRCCREKYDLNDLAEDYINDHYTQKELLDFYTDIGYSIDGLAELSFFSFLGIENPAKTELRGEADKDTCKAVKDNLAPIKSKTDLIPKLLRNIANQLEQLISDNDMEAQAFEDIRFEIVRKGT